MVLLNEKITRLRDVRKFITATAAERKLFRSQDRFLLYFLIQVVSNHSGTGQLVCNGLNMWLGSSVVLARLARGPGFESRSGHVLFPCL